MTDDAANAVELNSQNANSINDIGANLKLAPPFPVPTIAVVIGHYPLDRTAKDADDAQNESRRDL
jgi:hypothetical protein